MLMLTSTASAKVTGNHAYSGGEVTATYPVDGYGHNPDHPEWGQAKTNLGRLVPSEYGDGMNTPSLMDLPNARYISNVLCEDPAGRGADPYDIPDERGLSDNIWVWSQWVTHDMVFTGNQRGHHQYPTTGGMHKVDILIPSEDDVMVPGYYIPVYRSQYDLNTGNSTDNPREQINQISTWFDASNVYGSDQYRSDFLRTFEGGKLKTYPMPEGPIPPLLDPTNTSHPGMSFEGFGGGNLVVGDVRGNEHIALLSYHTLFLREHNRLAGEIAAVHPDWTDEQIYQRARKVVAGILQSITFNEFLPALGVTVDPYTGYDPELDPTIFNIFTHSAFRMGHSQIGSWTKRLDEDRTESAGGHIRLTEGFFDTRPLTDGGGLDPVIRGLSWQVEPKMDLIYSDDLRNQMFGAPNAGGMDLCAIDIIRGRDHGMPDYNTMRVALGFEAITNWSNITSDVETAEKLFTVYPDPGHADMFIGMLAEDHLENSSLGETMDAVIKLQFERVRDADYLFYLNDPDLASIRDELNNTRFADVILRNTNIEKIQCNVFFAEKDLENMACAMANEDKGFDPYVAPPEEETTNDGGSSNPRATPEDGGLPGFGINLTLISLMGAVIYISSRDRDETEE